MEYKDPGRYIPIIYLLYSWGSLFGVPSRVPLVQGLTVRNFVDSWLNGICFWTHTRPNTTIFLLMALGFRIEGLVLKEEWGTKYGLLPDAAPTRI